MIEKYKIKLIISLITVIFALTGAIFAMEDRYVSEKEASQSLQSFNEKVVQEFKIMKLSLLYMKYDNATKEYYSLRRLVRENPNDVELKNDLEAVSKYRAQLKEKIDNYSGTDKVK